MLKQGKNDSIRITTANISHLEEIQARQTRYLLSMSLRTICFVLALFASFANIDWLWPILIAAAIILPYIAVVAANAATNLTEGFELREARFSKNELK